MKTPNWLRQTKIIIGCILTALVMVAAWGWWAATKGQVDETSLRRNLQVRTDHSLVTLTCGGQDYTLEIANSPASITQGLSDRETIGSDGLIFVLPNTGYHSFWMPRMHFDLDLVWLDGDQIVDITAQVPAEPEKSLAQLPLYTSQKPANMVIEVASGQAQRWGWQVGDRFQLVKDK